MERDRFSYINTNRIPPSNQFFVMSVLVFCHVIPPVLLEPPYPCLSQSLATTLNLQDHAMRPGRKFVFRDVVLTED